MEQLPLAAIARVAADDFRRGREAAIAPALTAELASAIEIALLTTVRAERRACADECTRRGELWRLTAEKPDTGEVLRLQAECRANEALYLSDVIATRT